MNTLTENDKLLEQMTGVFTVFSARINQYLTEVHLFCFQTCLLDLKFTSPHMQGPQNTEDLQLKLVLMKETQTTQSL